MLFDTHAHYDDEKFSEDRDRLLKQIHQEGVGYILNAASDMASTDETLRLAREYDFIYAAIGIHPHSAEEMNEESIDILRRQAGEEKVVAIGEIGLDYHYDFAPREVQKDCFARQIALARELKLPIVVHDREAHEDVLKIIKAEKASEVGGIFHCYTGSVEMLRDVLENNFYVALGGAVTFRNARKLLEVAAAIPADRLLIETDCPYMTPEPFRGKRNHSGYLHLVAERIAEIRGMSFEELSALTTENAKRVFRIQ